MHSMKSLYYTLLLMNLGLKLKTPAAAQTQESMASFSLCVIFSDVLPNLWTTTKLQTAKQLA